MRDEWEVWRFGYGLAGILHVDPSDFTLRELVWMVEEQQDNLWDHTASIMAIIAEVNRDKKKNPTPFTAARFHPRKAKQKRPPVEQVDLKILKAIFVDRKPIQ